MRATRWWWHNLGSNNWWGCISLPVARRERRKILRAVFCSHFIKKKYCEINYCLNNAWWVVLTLLKVRRPCHETGFPASWIFLDEPYSFQYCGHPVAVLEYSWPKRWAVAPHLCCNLFDYACGCAAHFPRELWKYLRRNFYKYFQAQTQCAKFFVSNWKLEDDRVNKRASLEPRITKNFVSDGKIQLIRTYRPGTSGAVRLC